VFENRVLMKILGPKRDEVTGGWKHCLMRSFITYTPPHILLGHVACTQKKINQNFNKKPK
jgi:hypothetical protein